MQANCDRQTNKQIQRERCRRRTTNRACLPETNSRPQGQTRSRTLSRRTKRKKHQIDPMFAGKPIAAAVLLLALMEYHQVAQVAGQMQLFSPYARNGNPTRLLQTSHPSSPLLMPSDQQRCLNVGAPLQWRPHLDVASKSYLAPGVSLATLKHFSLTPIQLASLSGGQQAQFHAQNVNNVGVLIEATFQISTVLKRKRTMNLQPGQLLKLRYKVSASLSTRSDIIALASSEQQAANRSGLVSQVEQLAQGPAQETEPCALELTEADLAKRGSQLFKVGQDYVLFLDDLVTRRPPSRLPIQATNLNKQTMYMTHQQHQQHHHQAANSYRGPATQTQWAQDLSLVHPFATHETLVNQTSRSIYRTLCRNCVRAPSVQLVNSTAVSSATSSAKAREADGKRRVRIDCHATGNPAPWVEWFRNGKPLRNKSRGVRLRTNRVKRRPWERLSRLEIELESGRNETGIYECRAMSVAAREPAVGTYTLLVLPDQQFVLIPMEPAVGGDMVAAKAPDTHPAAGTRNVTSTTLNASSTGGKVQIGVNKEQQQTTSETNKPAGGQQLAPNADAATKTATKTTTPTERQAAELGPTQTGPSNTTSGADTTAGGADANAIGSSAPGAWKSSPVVVGQPCPREAHDNFCLNRGTCVLIGHIEEYFCNCAEGFHGHRCEYKSLGH